jgi:hypothetical protein
MTTEDAEQYRRKAEECRANARTATDDFERRGFGSLRIGWN